MADLYRGASFKKKLCVQELAGSPHDVVECTVVYFVLGYFSFIVIDLSDAQLLVFRVGSA